MQLFATGDPIAWCVSQFICLSVRWLHCKKMVEQIKVLFWVDILVD